MIPQRHLVMCPCCKGECEVKTVEHYGDLVVTSINQCTHLSGERQNRGGSRGMTARTNRDRALEFFASMMLAEGATLTPGNKAAADALKRAEEKQMQDVTQDRKAIKARARAEMRVSRVLRAVRHIGKLSRYKFSDAEVEKMFAAIEQEIAAARNQFTPQPQPNAPQFRFE
jgi:hypothetical protein